MRKLIAISIVALSLAGCMHTRESNNYMEKLVQYTQFACGFPVTTSVILSVIGMSYGDMVVTPQLGRIVCTALRQRTGK